MVPTYVMLNEAELVRLCAPRISTHNATSGCMFFAKKETPTPRQGLDRRSNRRPVHIGRQPGYAQMDGSGIFRCCAGYGEDFEERKITLKEPLIAQKFPGKWVTPKAPLMVVCFRCCGVYAKPTRRRLPAIIVVYVRPSVSASREIQDARCQIEIRLAIVPCRWQR